MKDADVNVFLCKYAQESEVIRVKIITLQLNYMIDGDDINPVI